nr:MAG: hypothetical protein [Molluscum contagiosum virus]
MIQNLRRNRRFGAEWQSVLCNLVLARSVHDEPADTSVLGLLLLSGFRHRAEERVSSASLPLVRVAPSRDLCPCPFKRRIAFQFCPPHERGFAWER